MWIPSAIPNRDPTTERRKKGQRRRASLLNLIVKAGRFDTHRDYVALRSGNEQGGACLRHAPPAHSHSWAHGGTPPAPRATASKHRTPVALTSRERLAAVSPFRSFLALTSPRARLAAACPFRSFLALTSRERLAAACPFRSFLALSPRARLAAACPFRSFLTP